LKIREDATKAAHTPLPKGRFATILTMLDLEKAEEIRAITIDQASRLSISN
jgi:hypothetical protein